MGELKRKVVHGAFWVMLEKCATQLIRFAVGMVLARLLVPDDFGLVALVGLFITIAGTLSNCGFGNALVQRKDLGDLELSSVFYLNVLAALVLYGLLFAFAPLIARFYHNPQLVILLRVSGIEIIICAINAVQGAVLVRRMLFNLSLRISLVGCILSVTTGLVLALRGWGVWALVISSLVSRCSNALLSWLIIAWRPRALFSFHAVKPLFSYGWKFTLSGFVNTLYGNLYGFLIGRFYTPADLAFVNKGNAMPGLLFTTIDGTISSISFPALAQLQDNRGQVRAAMRRMIRCSTFLVFPMVAGLSLCADELIPLLFGPQWLPAIPYVRIACFSACLLPFNTVNSSAILALGRSDIDLKLNLVKKLFGLLVIALSIRHGVLTLMLAMAFISSPFSMLVNTSVNGRLLGYSLGMQLRDVLPAALLSALMSAVVLLVRAVLPVLPNPYLHAALLLSTSALVGAAVYLPLSAAFKIEAFSEYVSIVKSHFPTRKSPRNMV